MKGDPRINKSFREAVKYMFNGMSTLNGGFRVSVDSSQLKSHKFSQVLTSFEIGK